MRAGRARFDHRLHQFESVQGAAESGLGVGDNRRKPVRPFAPFGVLNLIGALKRLIDPARNLSFAKTSSAFSFNSSGKADITC
jgi:hypothetical protein